MIREERVVLEPVEVAPPGRVEIDIHDGAILVGADGPDWGDYAINAYMAKREMGEVAVDEQIPNRVIELPLLLGASGDFDAARVMVEAWVAQVNHRGGGHLKRELIGGSYGEAGSKLYYDIVKATLKFGGGTSQARDSVDSDAHLTLEALPDFYGERIEEDPFEGEGEAVETFQVKGTLPGRAEILIEEKSGHDQLALPWHFRRQDYDAEAPWAMDIDSFDLIGAALEVLRAGTIANASVEYPSLGTSWTPVAAKTIKHKGVYEVFVRCYTTSQVPPEVRLLYDVGDLINPSETLAKAIAGRNGWYLLNLGMVNLQELPIGAHQARVMLQARGAAGGENVSFDRMWFMSATESSGAPTAPRRSVKGLAAPLVYDGFNQAVGGSATGKSPAVGSAYGVCTNSDSDDFQIDTATHTLRRSSSSDSGTIIPLSGGVSLAGRAIGSGSANRTNHTIAWDVSLPLGEVGAGHLVRWVDSENMVAIRIRNPVSNFLVYDVLKYRKGAGGLTVLDSGLLAPAGVLSGRMQTQIYEANVALYFDDRLIFSIFDADLAPGQPLAEGRCFWYDEGGVVGGTRIYDNLEVATLSYDAANFANQKAWLSHKGLYRMSPSGNAYGPLARQTSDLPRVPVSGPEERPVELAVKTSRGDLEAIQDSGAKDKLAVRFAYRPCWSQVPGL